MKSSPHSFQLLLAMTEVEPLSTLALASHVLQTSRESGSQLTPTQLHGLVYLTYAWSLALKIPTCQATVYAWNFGPLFKPLYKALLDFECRPIPGSAKLPKQPLPLETRNLIQVVWDTHKYKQPQEITQLTQDAAWGSCWRYGAQFRPIPNHLIRDIYQTKPLAHLQEIHEDTQENQEIGYC